MIKVVKDNSCYNLTNIEYIEGNILITKDNQQIELQPFEFKFCFDPTTKIVYAEIIEDEEMQEYFYSDLGITLDDIKIIEYDPSLKLVKE